MLICGDSMVELSKLPSDSVHLTVTSPPYDQIRDYKGKPTFDIQTLAKELLRVTVDGGMACVVIQDQTKNFRKSCTSFRLALGFVDAGWGLFETCIYARQGTPGNWWSSRWRVDHEYILQFFKGDRPRHFDKSSLTVQSINPGASFAGQGTRGSRGEIVVPLTPGTVGDTKCRGTIWDYAKSGSEGNRTKLQHPATFPDKLAGDLITAFSKTGDTVLDPFGGSGTTAVMARKMGREFIHIDIAQEYIEIAERRLATECAEVMLPGAA